MYPLVLKEGPHSWTSVCIGVGTAAARMAMATPLFYTKINDSLFWFTVILPKTTAIKFMNKHLLDCETRSP